LLIIWVLLGKIGWIDMLSEAGQMLIAFYFAKAMERAFFLNMMRVAR
jgi:hypothetical protein